MDHITIPIPDGMSEAQKSELAAWLTHQAAQVTPNRLPCEDDPAWRAETVKRIKRGMAEIEAGQSRPAKQGLRAVADEFGIKLDR
ncbi:MAG: hypothetical protein ACIAXF_02280 [Phycisphaerales bacterium JB063]